MKVCNQMVTYYQVGMLAMVCHDGEVELVSSQKQSQPWHVMNQWV